MSQCNITKNDVLLCVDEICNSQDEFTTLEVKNKLRLKGFETSQKEVSDIMSNLADTEYWNITYSNTNPRYRIYSKSEQNTNTINSSNKTMKHNKGATLFKNNNNTYTYIKRDGISVSSILAKETEKGDLEVYDIELQNFMYFKRNTSKDTARYILSIITGIPFVKIRCKVIK